MMRYLRGTVLLGVSAFLWACNAEPEGTEGGTPDKILADPTAVFVDLGATKSVLVRLVDQQGGALSAPITISNVGTGITVAGDSGFRPVYNSAGELVFNTFNNELRVLVSGNALSRNQFTVEAEGFSEVVDVTVMPIDFTGTVTGSPGDAATAMTVTAPAGLTFGPEARVVDAQGNDVAYVYAISDDGATATVYPLPGAATTAVSFAGIIPAYNPALSLTVPSTLDLELTGTVGAGFTGTDDFATAPAIVVPTGSTRGLVDVATFPIPLGTGLGGQVYRLEVAEDGLYDVELRWDGGEDLGIYLGNGGCSFDITAADAHGTGGSASPETTGETLGEPLALAAGSYCVGIVIFDGATANPETFNLLLRRH